MRCPAIARLTLLASVALLIACAGAAPAPGNPPAPSTPVTATAPVALPAPAARPAPKAPVALEEYFKIRRVSGASFSHDEKLIAYSSDEAGRPDIWIQPVGGGDAKRVTRVKGFIPRLHSPAADLARVRVRRRNELPHLYLTDSGGTERDLAQTTLRGTHPIRTLADDGAILICQTVASQHMILEYALATGKSAVLWQGSGKLSFAGLSRDHRLFVIQETISDVDSNLYLVERGKKAQTLLTPHQGEVLYEPQAFTRDKKSLFFTSDEGRELTALRKLDLAAKKSAAVLEPDWDVSAAGFSFAWSYFFTITNVDGTPELALSDARGKQVALPKPPGGGVFAPIRFSKSTATWLHAVPTPSRPR
jgi:hypothetical protein